MARYDNSANERGALGSRALIPSAIYYEPQINRRTVQGESTGAEALREGETENDITNIDAEA